jgi:uncharacterized membrane protein YeaQ/YmgE (transglycosylase-associated protein family)
MILALVWWVLIGLVIGGLAKLVMPGKDSSPWWVTALIGIGGSMLAGFVGRAVGHYGPYDRAGFFWSFVGAVIIVWVWRMVRRGGAAGTPKT